MSKCVCGHPKREHRDAVMSVPLTARTPLYALPAGAVNNIARTHPTATYVQEQCHCGCCSFDELH